MTTNKHDRKEGRSANSGFAKKRVQWLIEHSASHQLLWYVDSFVLRNPLLRKAAKRYRSVYKDSQPHIQAHLVLQTHKTDTKTKRA